MRNGRHSDGLVKSSVLKVNDLVDLHTDCCMYVCLFVAESDHERPEHTLLEGAQ